MIYIFKIVFICLISVGLQTSFAKSKKKKSPKKPSSRCGMHFVANFFESYLQQALKGNPQKQYQVGDMYLDGAGVQQNTKLAIEFFSKAARQGHVKAQVLLGNLFLNGMHGVEKDEAAGFRWFYQAAELGHAGSLNNVGLSFYRGRGTEKNLEKAKRFFERAVQAGSPEALLNLGNLATQEGNINQAIEYYKLAHSKKISTAAPNLAFTFFKLNKLEESFFWLRGALKQGDVSESAFNLATMHFKGVGTQKDIRKAIDLFQKAGQNDFHPAFVVLGHIYAQGVGVSQNREKAASYFEKAGQFNLSPAFLSLEELSPFILVKAN